MGDKIFKNVIIAVAGMLFLTACAGKDAVGEDTIQSDAVDLSGEMQSESVTENITDSVVIETVEGYDGETEEAYLVTIDEKAADYDGDGILDEVYRMGHMGQTDWDYYVNLSSCGKLYLGSASVGIGTGSELITCDLNGDGVDELVFLTGHVGADNPGSSTAYVYAYKDGGYAEFPLEQKENGRDFVIERDLTRARISCEAVDFSHTIWGTLKDMDMGYGFMQGTTVEHKSPRFIKLTEYEGRTAICYSYVFGSDLSGTYSVSEYVTYTGGTAQAVMVPDERYGSFEEINTYMNELAAEQSNYDIQYEYELGDDKMLYDVHRYIAEAGVDFLYVLYWYDDRGYYDNSLYIYVDNVPYSEEECIAIVELADDIEERFNIGEVEVGNFYVNTIEKYARAKNNSDSGTYYLYDEETDTYDVFMECEDVILYNQYNRAPTNGELAEYLGMSEDKLLRGMADAANAVTLSFEELLYEDNFEDAPTANDGTDSRLLREERRRAVYPLCVGCTAVQSIAAASSTGGAVMLINAIGISFQPNSPSWPRNPSFSYSVPSKTAM